MKRFDSLDKLLLAVIQYYLDNGYFYFQAIHYPEKKTQQFEAIDRQLDDKFGLTLNKGQRAYRKRKHIANTVGLRCDGLCLLLHTEGKEAWDTRAETFVDIRTRPILLDLGSVVRIELKTVDGKGTIKFEKRSFQDLKEIVKDFARTAPYWRQKSELSKIRNLPAVRRKMHLQKEHLFDLYRRECKRHGRRPMQ